MKTAESLALLDAYKQANQPSLLTTAQVIDYALSADLIPSCDEAARQRLADGLHRALCRTHGFRGVSPFFAVKSPRGGRG
jgi:hypothetical protein